MACDRISTLPESLLTHILSYLEIKDSVRTSALSRRWKYLWLKVPTLELNCIDYPYSEVLDDGSKCCVDKYLEFNDRSRMQKLKIHYDDLSAYRVHFVEWIHTMVDRGLQHLDVTVMHRSFARDLMPQNIYTSKTLMSLKLSNVGLMNPDPELGIYLPCLKIMHLEDNVYDHEGDDDASVLEKLISGCPVLEDLTLIFHRYELHNQSFVRVRSQTLKSFHYFFAFNIESRDFAVEIDAPELTYMRFCDHQSERIVVKNMSSLSNIYIYSDFNVEHGRTLDSSSKRDMIRDFLTGISAVRNMSISLCTLEVLFGFTRLGPIPKFDNVYRLQTGLLSSMLTILPAFLESFPNLNNLTLVLGLTTETVDIKLSHVPQCLLSSLECVEIKHMFMVEETAKKLARYFLENSAVLKKLSLSFQGSTEANQHSEDIFKEFHSFTKHSPGCEIIISIENVT